MKNERARLVDKCDAIWSLIVRAVDKRCVLCGTKENLQCGHLFSRGSYTTRYHPMNCFCQCKGSNMRHEFDAYPFNAWFIRNFGEPAWHELHALSAQTSHVKVWMFKEAYGLMLSLYRRTQKCRISRKQLNEASKDWLGYFTPSKQAGGTSIESN